MAKHDILPTVVTEAPIQQHGRSSRCRIAAVCALTLVIILDFLSALPTMARLYQNNGRLDSVTPGYPEIRSSMMAWGNDLSGRMHRQLLDLNEVQIEDRDFDTDDLIPVETIHLHTEGSTRKLSKDDFSREKLISMHSTDNTRIVVSIHSDLPDDVWNKFEFFTGLDTISMVESQFNQMRREELDHNIRGKDFILKHAVLKKAHTESNNTEELTSSHREDLTFTTLDNHLIIYYKGMNTTTDAMPKFTLNFQVQTLPWSTLYAKLQVIIDNIRDKQKKIPPEASNIITSEEFLPTVTNNSNSEHPTSLAGDYSQTYVEQSKVSDLSPLPKRNIWVEDGPLDNYKICKDGEAHFTTRDHMEIFFTLYAPFQSKNPIEKKINKNNIKIHEFELVEDTDNPGSFKTSTRTNDFDLADRKTVIYTHGFRSTSYDLNVENIVNAFFNDTHVSDINLIVADWRKGAQPNKYKSGINPKIRARRDLLTKQMGYDDAWINRHVVAEELLHLLHIVTRQVDVSKIHMIGHSLGAHICGEAAFYYFEDTDQKVGRITGLDPAGPCFPYLHNAPSKKRLDKTDAVFVDVWHTNVVDFGVPRPSGHVDFWFNGGKVQPFCSLANRLRNPFSQKYFMSAVNANICSHDLVVDYLIHSISTCQGQYASSPIETSEIEKFIGSKNKKFVPSTNATIGVGFYMNTEYDFEGDFYPNTIFGSGDNAQVLENTTTSSHSEDAISAWTDSVNYFVEVTSDKDFGFCGT